VAEPVSQQGSYGACPKNETCAFSEGLTHHCVGAGGVGYDKLLDWSPWKEPLPTRSWLTTPQYPPVGTVLWTSQIAPVLEPVFFRFLRLQACSATPHVLTGASMRGVPNRVFFTWGYMGVVFTHLLVRSCPVLGGNNCQHMPALVSVQWIGARDRHLSKMQ